MIYQGSNPLNTTALVTPGLYINVIAPTLANLNGVPTNVGGFVGVASWGAVNSPIDVSNSNDFALKQGNPLIRTYDIGTHIMCAAFQGKAAVYKTIRVTDGTDTKASFLVGGAGAGKTAGATVGTAGTGWTTAPILVASPPDIAGGTQAVYTATVADGAVTAVVEGTQGTGYLKPPIITVQAGGPGIDASFVANPVGAYDIGFLAKYTGVTGNTITITLYPGAAANTFRAVVNRPGAFTEAYNNIGGTGAALWANLAAAINSGQNTLSGPSQMITAIAGTSVDIPTAGTVYALAGGTDGASGVTDEIVMGTDGAVRTGMYAMRNTSISIAALCDVTSETTFANQVALGDQEGIYMVGVGPEGQTVAQAVTTMQTGGINSTSFVYILGDYPIVNDNQNGVVRSVSPQPFKVGVLANLNPSESSLNKPLQGVVSTSRLEALSGQGQPYSDADLQSLATQNVDVLTNPIPAGNVFGFRIGRNSSTNPVTHGDNQTRMTNYIAATLNGGMGYVIGMKNTPKLRQNAMDVIDAYLQNLYANEMIADWDVIYDQTLNQPSQVALGYLTVTVQVEYLAIVEFFIVNLIAGQSVQVTTSGAAQLAIAA